MSMLKTVYVQKPSPSTLNEVGQGQKAALLRKTNSQGKDKKKKKRLIMDTERGGREEER